MSTIASKNLYDLLGNDPDQDPELRTEPPPVAPIDKPVARKGKRDGPAEAPVAPPAAPVDAPRGRGRGRGGRGGGRGRRGGYQDGFGGNEEAFQDPEAGSFRNRDRPTDDGFQEERRGGRGNRGGGFEGREGRGGRGRGGRGGRGGAPRDDRHSRTIHSGPDDQAKQAARGWGDDTGEGELRDEQAGEVIAREESRQGFDSVVDKPVNDEGETPATDEVEPEPEDKTKSYSDYLAEQAEKKLQLGGNLQARKANEGASGSLPEGKAIEKEGEAEYFAGTGGKARRERERKERNTYVLEHDIQAREQLAPRGGARGGRGGRGGRGEGRGRGPAGRGARGEFRGRGGRGASGGPATATGPSPNVTNAADFPSLGS